MAVGKFVNRRLQSHERGAESLDLLSVQRLLSHAPHGLTLTNSTSVSTRRITERLVSSGASVPGDVGERATRSCATTEE